MPESSATLNVGDRAPEFTLPAANRTAESSLADALHRGPVIVEFLRGTW
jgi:peroxiredoxin